MEEKSIYNMIISMINIIVMIPLMILGIIFQKNSVLWISLFYPVLIASYIIKSISYGKDTFISRDILSRIADTLLDGGVALCLILFIMLLSHPIKWILLAAVITITVLEIIIDSIQKGLEIKYLLSGLLSSILIAIIIYLTNNIVLLWLSLTAIVLFYLSHVLGKILENKIILSFDLISMILFGIFLLLI